jgi:tetratricopeptide (TPR) repeat protein
MQRLPLSPPKSSELRDKAETALVRAGVNADRAKTIVADFAPLNGATLNVFDLLSAVDDQVGKAWSDQSQQQQLVAFRKAFADEVFDFARQPVEQSITANANEGWRAWLSLLAESVTRFRIPFAQRLFEISGPWNESQAAVVEKLRSLIRFMGQARWPEAYEGIEDLSGLDWLPQLIRARLVAILGQIQLLHFDDERAAKELFASAQALAPEDARVLCAVGELWLPKTKERQKAEDYFRRAIALEPNLANGYCDLGEFFEGKKDSDGTQYFSDAQHLYEQAIEKSPGDSLGYRWLLKFFGRQEFFEAHESDLSGLVQRGITASPEDEYQIRLDYGGIYNQRADFARARTIYHDAISVDPGRPDGYVVLAQTFEKAGNFEQSAEIYRQLVDQIPESHEGYLGLAWLAQQQERWAEALEWYQKAPRTVRQLTERFDARVGEMQARLGQYETAEETEMRLLKENPRNDAAKWALLSIGDDYYKEESRRERPSGYLLRCSSCSKRKVRTSPATITTGWEIFTTTTTNLRTPP